MSYVVTFSDARERYQGVTVECIHDAEGLANELRLDGWHNVEIEKES